MKQLTRYLPLILLAVTWELAARFELVSTTALPPLREDRLEGVAGVYDRLIRSHVHDRW